MQKIENRCSKKLEVGEFATVKSYVMRRWNTDLDSLRLLFSFYETGYSSPQSGLERQMSPHVYSSVVIYV
jgi:hypothetical protein